MSAKQLAALREGAQQKFGMMFSPQTSNNLQMVRPDQSPAECEVLCICNRQLQDILCSSCGFCFVGRVRKKCPVHPNAILLMDSACCPQCRTVHLIEIRTTSTPAKSPDSDGVEEELSHWRQRRLSASSNSGTDGDIHPHRFTQPTGPCMQGTSSKRALFGYIENSSDSYSGHANRMQLQRMKAGMHYDVEVGSDSLVHSSGNLGERFTRVQKNTGGEMGHNMKGWQNFKGAAKKQSVDDWENEITNMNDLCTGDKRY